MAMSSHTENTDYAAAISYELRARAPGVASNTALIFSDISFRSNGFG